MTVQIRKGVFETNSSSSHSLTIRGGDLVQAPFSDDVLRAGVVEIAVGEYGWEWYRYYTPEGKMSYLLTQVTGGSLPSGTPEEITNELREDDARIDMMCSVVEEYTGCKVLFQPSSGYVDHQSVGNGTEVFKDEAALKTFLFSHDCYIETGNDNSQPPCTISTDLGTDEDYYASCYGTPAKDMVEVKLTLVDDYQAPGYKTATGVLITEETHPETHRRLQDEGILTAVHWDCHGSWYRFEYGEPKGDTMAMFADRDDNHHMKFISDLKVTTTYTKAEGGRADVGTLTVKVPKDLAKDLK